MNDYGHNTPLFDLDDGHAKTDPGESPAPASRPKTDARHALDELFSLAGQYRGTADYKALLDFVTRFRFYSPYNAMLVHVQKPGATFVATPSNWKYRYGRRIKAGERPMVILQPMGPVLFVFDIQQTEETETSAGAEKIPEAAVNPYRVDGTIPETVSWHTSENVKRDGVRLIAGEAGSQRAGLIRTANAKGHILIEKKQGKETAVVHVPLRYELELNRHHSTTEQFATLAHELGHLYCGHLGTPDESWWPDRRGIPHASQELEAESVSFLVCGRMGLQTKSHEYVSEFVRAHSELPEISLDCVMKASGLIESMGKRLMPLRPKSKARRP